MFRQSRNSFVININKLYCFLRINIEYIQPLRRYSDPFQLAGLGATGNYRQLDIGLIHGEFNVYGEFNV